MRLVRSQKKRSSSGSSTSSAKSLAAKRSSSGSSTSSAKSMTALPAPRSPAAVPAAPPIPPIPDPPHPPTPRPWATLLDQRLDEIDARHPGDGDQLQWAVVKLLDQVLERNVSVAEYLTAAGCPIWLTLRTLFLQSGGS